MRDVGVPGSFTEELRKLAASRSRLTVAQSRSGRRPLRVTTLLRKDREGTLFKRDWHDQLPGGLADRKKPQDFPKDRIRQGMEVEREHVRDPAIQAEIAMDHLTEDPQYYEKLRRMEAGEKRAADADFERFQAKLKPGDILLTRAVRPTLMSKIVSGVQHSDFGHSSIYAGDGKVIDTRNHGEGVFQTSLREVYKKWGGGRDIRAYSPKATAAQRQKAVARAKELIGTPYHTMGAFRLLFPAGKNKGVDPSKKPKSVICSEVVARAYPDLPFAQRKNRAHVLPVDIAKSPLVRRKAELVHPDKLEKAAYRLQGHTSVQGIPIAIENRKGSVRSGEDPDGTPWRTKYKYPYGYIVGTEGNDGEDIDAYVGPDKDAPNVYVVHQHKIDGTGFDEDKVFFGFLSEAAVRKAYLEHYNKVGKKLLGPISTMSIDALKKKLEQSRKHTKLAFASGPTGSRSAMVDLDEKPDRFKPGDVPSRDGTNPGAARVEKGESGPDMKATVSTLGTQASSETGATTRL